MNEHQVAFPCAKPFERAPIVVPSIVGPAGSTKLFATSLRSVTPSAFTVNVQRVDDVDSPDMDCADIQICYIAVVM